MRVSKFIPDVRNLITLVSYRAAALLKPFRHAFQEFSGCVSIYQRLEDLINLTSKREWFYHTFRFNLLKTILLRDN